MELKKGMKFTGSPDCFSGVAEVLIVDTANNKLHVKLYRKEAPEHKWSEEWDLKHTIWGFERDDYRLIAVPVTTCDELIPRRNNLQLNTPAELAIRDAMQSIEALPANELLTLAISKLSEALERVGDYVDSKFGGRVYGIK